MTQETQRACFIFLEVASYKFGPNIEEKVFWKSIYSYGVAEAGDVKGDVIKIHSLKATLLLKGTQHFEAFGVDLQQKWVSGRGK